MTINYKLLGVPYVVAASAATGMSTTGSVTENTLASITIPGGAMGANGSVRITAVFSLSNNANTKVMRIKFGGTTYTSVSLSNSTTLRQFTQIINRNSVSSQVGAATFAGGFSSSSGAAVTSSVDTSSDVTLLITGQNGNSADTITLESYLVEVIYRP
jgi:hypothetical protein